MLDFDRADVSVQDVLFILDEANIRLKLHFARPSAKAVSLYDCLQILATFSRVLRLGGIIFGASEMHAHMLAVCAGQNAN